MPSVCGFQLNKANAVYYSGETIIGSITLNTTSDKNVRGIFIIFLGEGKVELEANDRRSHYNSHEVYADSSICVHNDGILPAGTHSYDFAIVLSHLCPTSCEGRYGHIRYELSLKLSRPFRYNNVFKKPLTVIKPIDLNLNPAYRIPLVLEEISELCCSCSSGKIISTLKVPLGAYAPGQSVDYSLHIANQTMTIVEGYTLKFTKKLIFTAKLQREMKLLRQTKETLVVRRFDESCQSFSNRFVEGEFIVPPTPPTTSRNDIICIEYKIQVTVWVSGCNANSVLKIPIVIGTLPLRESLTDLQERRNVQADIAPLAPEWQTGDFPPNYEELEPPSFEEATRSTCPFINTGVDEHNRIVEFRPLYPMYRNSSRDGGHQ